MYFPSSHILDYGTNKTFPYQYPDNNFNFSNVLPVFGKKKKMSNSMSRLQKNPNKLEVRLE